MKYSLVLQWPASSIKDYNTFIGMENALIRSLTDGSKVDGHDAGSGEMNIFIHTENPERTFAAVKAVLGTRDFWIDGRAAYRNIAGNDYTVLWPEDLERFNVA